MVENTEDIKKEAKEEKQFGIIDYDTAEALRQLALERYSRFAEDIDRLLKSKSSTKKLQL